MKKIYYPILCLSMLAACNQKENNASYVIGKGSMPSITKGEGNTIHVVYGKGDSIMYVNSVDGTSYSTPSLVAILPELAAAATRGPQIAATSGSIIITAADKPGNIYSYTKNEGSKWTKTNRVNDLKETAKEGLMALGADGNIACAVWLSVNDPKGQSVYGATSVDGGKTWRQNMVVYSSPSGTVCECCKPSVAVVGNDVYVMFRNFLEGNRDMYLIKSSDGGRSFAQAQKIGNGNWKLEGCPMDGGSLAINNNRTPETVWRRQSKIYTAEAAKAEEEIGDGRSCTIATINNQNVFAWTQNGNVILNTPGDKNLIIGKGSMPVLKAINNATMVCIYENEDQIHAYSFKPHMQDGVQ